MFLLFFRIIHYYVLREQAGTLAPPKSDMHKVSPNGSCHDWFPYISISTSSKKSLVWKEKFVNGDSVDIGGVYPGVR